MGRLHEGDICLIDKAGTPIIYNSLREQFNKKEIWDEIEKNRIFITKEHSYIPHATCMIIKTNTRGVMLAETTCVHCNKNIIMTHSTIKEQSLKICPICDKNIYDIKDRTKYRRW